jgi:hypothetical protein
MANLNSNIGPKGLNKIEGGTMIKKISFLAIIFVITGVLLQAEKLATLPDIVAPRSFDIAGDKLYIIDKTGFFLYSMKDFTLIKRFGKQGEGPGEFKTMAFMSVYPEFLQINTWGKIMFFSRDGEFLRERKAPMRFFSIYTVGEHFVGWESKPNLKTFRGKRTLAVFNKDFEPIA